MEGWNDERGLTDSVALRESDLCQPLMTRGCRGKNIVLRQKHTKTLYIGGHTHSLLIAPVCQASQLESSNILL